MYERERRVIYTYREMYTLLFDIDLKKAHCEFVYEDFIFYSKIGPILWSYAKNVSRIWMY